MNVVTLRRVRHAFDLDYVRGRLRKRATSFIETRQKLLRSRAGAQEFYERHFTEKKSSWPLNERVCIFMNCMINFKILKINKIFPKTFLTPSLCFSPIFHLGKIQFRKNELFFIFQTFCEQFCATLPSAVKIATVKSEKHI